MTKTYIDLDDKNAIDSIDKAIKIVDELNGMGLSAPYDFSYKTTLSNCAETIRNMKPSLVGLRSTIEDSQRDYKKALSDFETDISKISNLELKQARNVIK